MLSRYHTGLFESTLAIHLSNLPIHETSTTLFDNIFFFAKVTSHVCYIFILSPYFKHRHIGRLLAFQMFAGRMSPRMLRLVDLCHEFQQADITVIDE